MPQGRGRLRPKVDLYADDFKFLSLATKVSSRSFQFGVNFFFRDFLFLNYRSIPETCLWMSLHCKPGIHGTGKTSLNDPIKRPVIENSLMRYERIGLWGY